MSAQRFKIHPVAAMVPKMSAEAFAALKEDIATNGLREPIWIKDREIVDGRHRYRACQELGIRCNTRVFEGDDVETFVISMNVARRQLSTQQRRWFIKRLLELHPETSNRTIARAVGVSHVTVLGQRRELESIGQSDQCSTVTCSDGRAYPARRTPQPTSSLIHKTEMEAKRFIKWLDHLHPHELTDGPLFISQLQTQVERLTSLLHDKATK